MFINNLWNKITTRDFNQTVADELPISTRSLCPECRAIIDARLADENGSVFMYKSCQEHGEFRELISSDTDFFLKMRRTHYERPGPVENPARSPEQGCPWDCGVCSAHRSFPSMVNIDLTNRCNLNCPICFANSNAAGRVYELSWEQIDHVIESIAALRPHPVVCVQFAGGEPTLHPYFLHAVNKSKYKGFSQIQAASNGVRFARSSAFAEAAAEAGLDVVYLQFDGMSDDIYRQTRGRPMLETKMQAIENLGRAGIRVALVPTIVKGFNDHQVGEILKFAAENVDVVTAISWQPVSFTGRIDETRRREMRFTTADLARSIQDQTGIMDMHRDWYPFSIVAPLSRFMEAVTGEKMANVNCHPHCGCVTYLLVDKQSGQSVPFPAFLDIEAAARSLNKNAARMEHYPWMKKALSLQLKRDLKKHFRPENAPAGWDHNRLMQFIEELISLRQMHELDKKSLQEINRNRRFGIILSAAMHFQDLYNYELDRVRQCIVHYADPQGNLYPFCTWNSGPCHRYRVEEMYSRAPGRQEEEAV